MQHMLTTTQFRITDDLAFDNVSKCIQQIYANLIRLSGNMYSLLQLFFSKNMPMKQDIVADEMSLANEKFYSCVSSNLRHSLGCQ